MLFPRADLLGARMAAAPTGAPRLAVVLVVVALAFGLGARPASAELGWYQTKRGMQAALRTYGLEWGSGMFERVWYADCRGVGQKWFWRGGKKWWARFRCFVISGGDARRVLTVWPTGEWPWQFRFKETGYW